MTNPVITLHPQQKGASLGDLYGIFFEDLNHAADGGLYAEMIQNRSFEFCPIDNPEYHGLYGWQNGAGQPLQAETLHVRVLEDAPLHANNTHYLKIDVNEGGELQNDGFNHGLALTKGAAYDFSLFARTPIEPVHFLVQLKEADGRILAQETVTATDREWQRYEGTLIAAETSTTARLALVFDGGTNIALDMISLFPQATFKNRKNGCRKDIAELLAAMKPKFMRFPGGCLVHDGSLNAEDRDSMYRWKNTVGPVEHRSARRNSWGYNQTLGLGFYEYFLLCEDLGAKPLPVLPAGWDPHHQRAVPIEELGEWIQDALDLIEFANGDPETKWGRLRSEMGHPEPFGMEYLAVGNEEVGQEFFDRYDHFHKAIREAYPEIQLINSAGPFAAGSEYERGWESARRNGSDLVDEHYYQTTDWLLANHDRYDHYPADGPKVFLGEYASWGNEWYNAAVEASYMIGLERNADKVGLACYAPMLANVDYVNWRPDMIWFDQSRVYGSMNYYVQQLFTKFQGTCNMGYEVSNLAAPKVLGANQITGGIGVVADNADISYRNVRIIDHLSGEEITPADGTIAKDQRVLFTEDFPGTDYTIAFEFEKTGGQWDRGFRLLFGEQDPDNTFAWLLGGWQNQDCMIRSVREGRISDITQTIWKVETGKRYSCELHVKDRQITTTINGVVMNEIEAKVPVVQQLYVNAVLDEAADKQYVKLVNVADAVTVSLEGITGEQLKVRSLSAAPDAVNDFETPENFTYSETEPVAAGGSVAIQLPQNSVVFVEISD